MLKRLLESLGWWAGWLIVAGLWPVFRLRAHNAGAFPKEGPFLLLPNHTSLMDPAWVAWPAGRRLHFMASSALFRRPLVGPLVRSLGAFPKQRFQKDRGSMEEVQRLWDLGRGITIFPEGLRSWDGRTQPVGVGIGRLIKRLDATVVFARIQSGHHFQPRWADYPRFVPVHVEYEGPVRWPEEATPEEIAADVARRIGVEVDYEPEGLKLGLRRAHGLPAYLWACPACFALEGLQVAQDDSNAVACSACGARWEVGCTQRLSGHSDLTVRAAHDRIRGHFGSRPEPPERGDGPLLSAEGAVEELGGGGEVLARGTVELYPERLTVDCGHSDWNLPLEELDLVLMEVGDALHLRTRGRTLRLHVDGQSTLKWAHFLRSWREPGR